MTITAIQGRSIYSGYNVTATSGFVYSTTASTDSSAGWFSCRGDNVLVTVGLATLNATYVEYRIEGKFDTHNRPFTIYNASLNSVTIIDTPVVVSERCSQLRVGVKVNNAATPNNFYCGLCLAETK